MKKILEICCKGRTATTAPVEEAVPPVDVPGPAPAAADAPPAASETVEEAVADQHPAEEPAASGSQGEQAQEAAALEEAAVVETVPTTSAEAVADEPGGHPLAAASTAMRRFEGKVVIVTGSSSGIGREAAVLFAEEGASLTIHGQSSERIEATKQRLHELGVTEDRIVAVQGPIQDLGTLQRIVNETVGKFGRIDVLVNNAGVMKKSDVPVDSIDNYDFTFEVNVRSVIQLTELCLPYLQESKGSIVNVSSMLAIRPAPAMNFYSMSKAAIDHYTRNMANRCALYGVRVNGINPGVTYTDFHTRHGMSGDAREQFEKTVAESTLLGRSGQPVEIAKVLVVLASSDASYVTGANWLVDGGRAVFTKYAQPTLYDTNETQS